MTGMQIDLIENTNKIFNYNIVKSWTFLTDLDVILSQ